MTWQVIAVMTPMAHNRGGVSAPEVLPEAAWPARPSSHRPAILRPSQLPEGRAP